MARKPKHKTFNDILQYYINLYYVVRERNPGIKQSEDKHIHKIELAESDYHKELERHYPQWDTEENKARFRTEIDFLTSAYTNIQINKSKKIDLKALKEKLKR